MEENIKRVEQLIERCKQCKSNACITCDICWSEVQAIENLLKGYKELEEYYEEQNEVNAKFIPISVIQNKIKDLESYKGLVMYEKYNYESTIRHLKELLNES